MEVDKRSGWTTARWGAMDVMGIEGQTYSYKNIHMFIYGRWAILESTESSCVA